MAAKKPAAKTKAANVPLFGDIGYKFMMPAAIHDVDLAVDSGGADTHYLIRLGNNEDDNIYTPFWVDEKDLVEVLISANPTFKQELVLAKIKKTEALLAKLKQELAAVSQ